MIWTENFFQGPFILSPNPALRKAAAMSRRKFSADSKSDHMVLLRAFQGTLLRRKRSRKSSKLWFYKGFAENNLFELK